MIEVAVFPCTYRCDAKCIMCSIHERHHRDVSVKQFELLFKDRVMRQLKSINITGGEPTLRSDLNVLVNMITKHCKNIKEIIINTNGLNTEQVLRRMEEVLSQCDSKIRIFIYVSLDAVDENASVVRGVKLAAERAIKTIRQLKKLEQKYPNLNVGVACTITSKNLLSIRDVFYFAKRTDVYIDFIMATVNSTYIDSESKSDQFVVDERTDEIVDFLFSTLEYPKTVSSGHYFGGLKQNQRSEMKSCILRQGKGILIEADGKIRSCGMTDEVLLGDIFWPETFKELGKDVTEKMSEYCKKCKTDSFYLWNAHGQKELKENMFKNLIAERVRRR